MKWPVYAPLRFEYDRARALTEARSLAPDYKAMFIYRSAVLNPDTHWRIAPQAMYDGSGYWDERGNRSAIVPTWVGIGLLHVPGVSHKTVPEYNRVRDQYAGQWEWSQIAERVPYLKELTARLPFESVDVARIMSIPAGGFVPVHADEDRHGLVGIGLVLESGGVPMQIRDRRFDVSEVDAPAFFFLGHFPHGVPPVKSPRTILRVNGRPRAELRSMLILDEALP